jgi:membrane protein
MGEPKPSSLHEMLRTLSDHSVAWAKALPNRGRVAQMVYAIVGNVHMHHATQLASAMAFDLFLALIPLLALGGWVVSVVLQGDMETLASLSSFLDVAPRDVHQLVNENAERFNGVTLAPIALLGSVWLGSGAFDTVMAAFERTRVTDPRPWYVRRLLAIVCVLCVLGSITLGGWVTLRLAGGPELVLRLLPKPRGFEEFGIDLDGSRLVGFAVSTTTISLLIAGFFRIGILRDVPRRRVWPGTVVTIALASTASYLFAVYARTLAKFALYYGSLAAVAILLAWLWLCSFALLLGAEVNVYLEERPSLFARKNKRARSKGPMDAPPSSRG